MRNSCLPVRYRALLAVCVLACSVVGFVLACSVVGCNTTADRKPAAKTNYATIDAATAATISGTIRFIGTQPERLDIDMALDPACILSYPGAHPTEQYVIRDGGVANVFVYVSAGLNGKRYAPPPTPVLLDQKGCRYFPHGIGVMAGQPVEFRNSDPTLHNVHPEPAVAGNVAFDVSQPPMTGVLQRTFAQPELMIPVRCNHHPWMSAFINVAENPFYAVSGGDGRFEIKGLPPGTYTVVAVHEKLGTKTAQVTVQPHQRVDTEFTFRL